QLPVHESSRASERGVVRERGRTRTVRGGRIRIGILIGHVVRAERDAHVVRDVVARFDVDQRLRGEHDIVDDRGGERGGRVGRQYLPVARGAQRGGESIEGPIRRQRELVLRRPLFERQHVHALEQDRRRIERSKRRRR